MKVLIACEFSGIVRNAFTSRGHDACSCDLLDTEKQGNHIIGDVSDILNDKWDLMIAHPPCTFLTVAANRWMLPKYKDKYPSREEDRIDAINFFMKLVNAKIDKICIENPIGIMSTRYKKPAQIIQPYQFGDKVQKATCLWLKNLPLLKSTKIVDRGLIYVDPQGKKHGGAFTMRAKRAYSPLMLLHKSEERWKIRSRTFQGIADAMATQWGMAD